MRKKHFAEEQIAFALRRAESGTSVAEINRKLGLIDQVDQWMEMREVRKRIAHDYLSDKVQGIYGLLIESYRPIVAEADSPGGPQRLR